MSIEIAANPSTKDAPMKTKTQIDRLWEEFRDAIDAAYEVANKTRDDAGICLRDYAQNVSWNDNLKQLLQRETAKERQHRSNRPSVPGFSAQTAAKLILLNQASAGSLLATMPQATEFLVFRQTAAEARVIGFLIRESLSAQWRESLAQLDYSTLMKSETAA
jgi:ABC-type branched-subunit amino acid transport system substrate-binding protein